MNNLELLKEYLNNNFEVYWELDPAETKTGEWFLQIRIDKDCFIVEWNPNFPNLLIIAIDLDTEQSYGVEEFYSILEFSKFLEG